MKQSGSSTFVNLFLVLLVSLRLAGPSQAGQSADSLFLGGGIQGIALSPTGEWVLAVAQKRGVYGVLVQKLGTHHVTSLFASKRPILGLDWVGEKTFITHLTADGPRSSFVAQIREVDAEISIEVDWINAPGRLVDSLPLIEDELIWEIEHEGRSSAHRVSLENVTRYEEARSSRRDLRLGKTLATIDGSAQTWIVDRRGIPRAVSRDIDGNYTILVRESDDGDFREVYGFESKNKSKSVFPLSLSESGDALIVAAYNGHDTMGLFEFDMKDGSFGETIFIRDDVDITDVVFDYKNGELIAAVYEIEGERRYHYFESYADQHLPTVRASFPKEEVAVLSSSADRSIFVLWVSSPTNPGTYYFHDVKTGEMNPIGDVAQGLDRSKLVDVETVEVESEDGTRIEIFLALPNDLEEGGAPLIVMPHGGPIGVRDNKDYNPIVQYFASWGFAFLQVNYRGSSGYGRKFEEAGKKQWAQGIEDDIDAAVEYAIARPEIDGTRICIVGGSYGGFSALASVIRHETRYRCAASLNGVTDVPFSFAGDDCAGTEGCLEEFALIVGDPKTERDKLIEISPAYHVDEIHTPVFVIYGTEDRRVDPDHSHRLLLMLETFGKEYESLEVKGASHSPTKKEWEFISVALRRFLTRYLFPSAEFVGDPIRKVRDPQGLGELPTVNR
ncbi:MAG: S9 family peptidase [Deltaproteobacteria bacterium]|nr:S9 family peptidase [Deltaproteobacteria bacterium]